MAITRFTRREPRFSFPTFLPTSTFPAFADVENRMNRFMERMLSDPFEATLPESIGWLPAMDIVENDEALTLTAELPGLSPKDIDVTVENGVLTVKGEKTEERREEGKEKKVHLYERTYGSFQRSFALPPTVDGNAITAKFDNGVLSLSMPKTPAAKASAKKIEIK